LGWDQASKIHPVKVSGQIKPGPLGQSEEGVTRFHLLPTCSCFYIID